MNRSSYIKGIVTIAVILLLTAIQTSAGRIFAIKSIAPDLLFAFSLANACTEKKWFNVINAALICGLFSDFVCHSEFLGYTAVYSYSALATYFLKNLLLKPNAFFISTLAIVIFIMGKTLLFPVFYFTRETVFTQFFLNDVLPSAVYNTACFCVIYFIIKATAKRKERYHAAEI